MNIPRSTIAILDLAEVATHAGADAFRMLGRHSLLEWTIRRLAESTLLDAIAIIGPHHCEPRIRNSTLCHAVWMPTDETSSVLRSQAVMDQLNARWGLFVRPSCPFVDPVLVDRLIRTAWSNPECDYVGFYSLKRPTFCVSGLGLTGEICSRKCFDIIGESDQDGSDRELNMGAHIRNSPDLFQMRLLPLPEPLDHDGLRFAIETKEDWDHGHMLIDAGADEFDWQRLSCAVRIDRPHGSVKQSHLLAGNGKTAETIIPGT